MRTTRFAALLLSALTVGQSTSAQSDRWVDSTLAGLSLEEKIGQMFVVEFVGLFTNGEHPAYRYALDVVTRLKVGGCILGGGAALDIPYVTNSLQKAARVPLLINGDLEAGMSYVTVWRRSRGWTERLPSTIASGGTQFPSQMAIGATGEPRYAYELGRITALESRAVGIQWTNSPVADVNSNADNPVINTRSFGEDPAQVAAMVGAYVRGAEDGRVISTLKHFPGHGDTREDSHMGLPSLPFDRARLNAVEFVPFKAGIAAGARAVMTSHLALPRIDPSGRPATLSSPVLTGILREDLGFGGIIVTDGMRMQGITDRYSSAEAAVLAVEAGVDVILAPVDADSAVGGLIAAVRSGRISSARIDASVRRILSAKAWVGLADRRTVPVDSVFTLVGSRDFGKIAQEISDASVTLLRNERKVIPFPPSSRVVAVAVTEDPSAGISTDFVEELLPAARLGDVDPGLQRHGARTVRRHQGFRPPRRCDDRRDLPFGRRLEG